MSQLFARLCGASVLFWVAVTAAAQTPLPDVSVQPPMVFATSTVRPWGMTVEGVEQGLLVEVMEALEVATGIEAINYLQPYPRVIYSVYSGVVDMAILFDSPSAQESAIRIGHVVDSRVLVVGRAGAQSFSSLADLNGQLVGYIRGSKYGPSFDSAEHFDRVAVNTMQQGLAMLVRHRLDAMAGTDQAFFWAMKKMRLGTAQLSQLMVVRGASGSLYMSKKSQRQDLIPLYQKALKEMREDGTLSHIFSESHEWGEPENWPTTRR